MGKGVASILTIGTSFLTPADCEAGRSVFLLVLSTKLLYDGIMLYDVLARERSVGVTTPADHIAEVLVGIG